MVAVAIGASAFSTVHCIDSPIKVVTSLPAFCAFSSLSGPKSAFSFSFSQRRYQPLIILVLILLVILALLTSAGAAALVVSNNVEGPPLAHEELRARVDQQFIESNVRLLAVLNRPVIGDYSDRIMLDPTSYPPQGAGARLPQRTLVSFSRKLRRPQLPPPGSSWGVLGGA